MVDVKRAADGSSAGHWMANASEGDERLLHLNFECDGPPRSPEHSRARYPVPLALDQSLW
jgi:hypothetical protein